MRRIRVTAHVHSTWSYDGSWSLEAIARSFARRGYRAVLMAEHSQTFSAQKWQEYREACADASTSDLLLVPGIEYADADDVVHLPTWGEVPFLGTTPAPGLVAEAAVQAGAVTVMAHPSRRNAWRRVDPEWARLLSGVEIWNRKYDGWAPRAAACAIARESGLRSFVALDFHTRRQFFPLALAAQLPGEEVTVPAVYAALRDGLWQPQFARLPAAIFAHEPVAGVARVVERGRSGVARVLRAITG